MLVLSDIVIVVKSPESIIIGNRILIYIYIIININISIGTYRYYPMNYFLLYN